VAEISKEQVFNGKCTEVFAGIKKFEKYPDYLPGVTGIKVLPAKKSGSTCQVRYELKLIKSFFYTLNMFEEAPNKIWWDMDESNIMKYSNGSWDLADLGSNKVKAIYKLDVGFSGFVPQKIVDQIAKANLELMMNGFQKLIDDQAKGKIS
jgi:ribosome-associated toxin RatA of RatAB toxin-antitoxin module